jgi:glycosyltransferase involved in cell wall biosynthesis
VFTLTLPEIDYCQPTSQSLAHRLLQLSHGSRHVAYFYPRPNTGTFRYRVLNMIEGLAAADPSIGASCFFAEEVAHLDTILARSDVIVICHAKYSADFARLVARAHASGKKVLYDIDDLVFDNRYVPLVLSYLGHPAGDDDIAYWFADFGRYGGLMRLCDGVIATNEFLACRIADFCGLPTRVIPNFMNRAQLDLSAELLDLKRASAFARDERIHIGYFSGSPTHRRDFGLLADALGSLMDSDSRVILRIVGALEPEPSLARFGNRIESFPLQHILNLQRLVGEVEINLVPLQDNVFTNCKSELKVFEAAAVGTISIASPCFALRNAIREGETGYLAPAHRWLEVLRTAIRRLDRYPTMAQEAARWSLRRYVPGCSRSGNR